MNSTAGAPVQDDWLDDGSMHLLLPLNSLEEWHGIDSGDYDRACTINEWLGVLPVGDGIGFVLGGDPGMLLVDGHDSSVLLIRWIYAEDETELIRFARRGDDVVDGEPDIRFDNFCSEWRLLNAAVNPIRGDYSFRPVILPIGPIQIRTAFHQSERNAAVVHRFVPLA